MSIDTCRISFVLSIITTFGAIFYCPFNKVEESFNMQAVHDVIYHGMNITYYDHIKFPGPVPRTFIGSLTLSLPCSTLRAFVHRNILQLFVRSLLGIYYLHAIYGLSAVFKARLGQGFCGCFLLITFSQFHLTFYASRTLPNVFALITVLHSLKYLFGGADRRFIMVSGFGIIVFRSELMIFYGPLLIFGLVFKLVRIRTDLILTGILTALVSLGLSISVDSFFWQRLVWPEGEVFYFNAIENKSHLWGVLPIYWYFLVALPKALMTSTVLVLCFNVLLMSSMWSTSPSSPLRSVFFGLECVAISFVGLYSFLPHKELRFIIYAIPIFNLLAAYFWNTIDNRLNLVLTTKEMKRNKGGTLGFAVWIYRLIVVVCYASVFLNLCISLGLLYASSYNYPGGVAIDRLNHWPGLSERRDVHVYISNLAAQTGVNRFQQIHNHWIYNKTEKIEDDARALVEGPFTHLILETKKDSLAEYNGTFFRQLFTVDAYSGVSFHPGDSLFEKVRVSLQPALVVYERNESL